MKTIVTVLFAGMFSIASLVANAQFFNSSRVPEAVKISFRQRYPEARHIDWGRKTGGYQVEFKLHRTSMVALYDEEGNTLAEVTGINKIKLPRRARKQLHDNYTSFAVETTVKITTASGKVTYEAYIDRAEEAFDLVFNDSGYLLSVIPVAVPTE